MEFKDRYTYEDFLDIIAMLRSENGCPWDKVQTHDSLRPCMMEEAAEVLAAIRIYDTTGNAGNLQEELGDVLLQVVMHAQIAKEEGIIAAIESSHAVAHLMKIAPTMSKDQIIICCLSGRGDKDVAAIARYRGIDLHE